jgi:hypothetical protein
MLAAHSLGTHIVECLHLKLEMRRNLKISEKASCTPRNETFRPPWILEKSIVD